MMNMQENFFRPTIFEKDCHVYLIDNESYHSSRVMENRTEEKKLVIALPFTERDYLQLEEGTTKTFEIYHEERVYTFDTEIAWRESDQDIEKLIINYPQKGKMRTVLHFSEPMEVTYYLRKPNEEVGPYEKVANAYTSDDVNVDEHEGKLNSKLGDTNEICDNTPAVDNSNHSEAPTYDYIDEANEANDVNAHHAKLWELSSANAALAVLKFIRPGTEIQVQIEIGSSYLQEINLRGIVVDSYELKQQRDDFNYGVNVIFTDIDETTGKKVNKFVEETVIKKYQQQLREKLLDSFYTSRKLIRSPYEPVAINNTFWSSEREWKTRWKMIKAILEKYEAKNIVDVGCAEGWFVRLVANQLGCFAIGLELDNIRVIQGEIARLHDNESNYAMVKMNVTPELIAKIPHFDVALCLSVIHHVIKVRGMEEARKLIYALSRKTNKAIIFEIGFTQELMQYAKYLPGTPQDRTAFAKSFLESSGFTNVQKVGKSLSIKRESMRDLLVAEPVVSSKYGSVPSREVPN